MTIRNMREEDAEAVREVNTVAFNAWERQVRGEVTQPYPRTLTNVLACREKDPKGCFVAEEDGRVVGFILSRTWGGVGWFGPFAMLPKHQGHGIGKRLIAASLEYLRQDPGRVIGLETMPESSYNLGLYMRLGFQPRLPTFLLGKSLDEMVADEAGLPRWSTANVETRERWLADLREGTGQIHPSLDYTKEITSAARHSLGETLVLIKGEPIGLSIVGLVSPREEPVGERAHVEILALHPAHTDDETFRILLGASEALARESGREVLTMTVNARHTRALEWVLERGYRFWPATVLRMVLKGTDAGPSTDGWVNLSRWAG